MNIQIGKRTFETKKPPIHMLFLSALNIYIKGILKHDEIS